MVFGIPARMKWTAAAAALILSWIAAPAAAEPPPLSDPAFLNIGLSCRWDMKCIDVQRKAMKRALGYVRKARPPAWRVQLCNRNASRGYQRVDWVGFDHCIRNAALRPPPPLRRHARAQQVRSRR
jgi:hypothetical protein